MVIEDTRYVVASHDGAAFLAAYREPSGALAGSGRATDAAGGRR